MAWVGGTYRSRRGGLAATAIALALCYPGLSAADDAVSKEDLQQLVDELERQKEALAEQQRVIANQQNQLNFLKGQIGMPDDPQSVPVVYTLGPNVPSGSASGIKRAQDEGQPVGEAPEQTRPEIAIIPDQGGVLTRRGQLVIEPSLTYTHTSQDRFFFQGFEVVDTVLIGLIEATSADRNSIEAAIGGRIGVTDRLELEARVPYLYRNDRFASQVITRENSGGSEKSIDGNGIGDVEVAAHYDFTNLIFDAPYSVYTVANLKVKTVTGEGPFDVDLDENGDPEELATGSGFWGVQPSFTAIFPSDPVVFYGTAGYTINIADKINKSHTVTPECQDPIDVATCPDPIITQIGDVDPGDSVNASIGMGLSLNERTSLSLGFSFDYVFPTEQDLIIDGTATNVESDPLYVGEFLVGASYQISETVGLNLSFSVGATEAAPDFETTLRVPIRFQVF